MRLLLCLALAAACVLSLPASALAQKPPRVACTCLPPDLETRALQAERIFLGTVRSIETVETMIQPGRKDPPVIVTFDVEEGFKDASNTQQVLHTSLTRVTCAGYPFEEGKIGRAHV